MAANQYDIGDLVRITAAFTSPADAAADPTTVKIKYRKPDLTVVTLTYGADAAVIKDSAGNFHADITITEFSGEWWYRAEGTGAVQAAAEGTFVVRDSRFD